MRILVLNGGSSSIKFSMYLAAPERDGGNGLATEFEGELDGIGRPEAKLKVHSPDDTASADGSRPAGQTQEQAIELVLGAIAEASSSPPEAVGYRVVHPGARLQGHQRVTPEVLKDLERAVDFAPLHDPEAVQLLRATMKRYPGVPHYVCFDTVFHDTMPAEATTYPLPPEYGQQGVRRYGFHGLSCESIVRQLRARGQVPQRMVIAHLGSGCSVTAVIDGCSVDTTMGLTPTGGVIMGTRSGDLDPGLVFYLLRQQQGTNEQAVAHVETLLNHHSGMVALTGMANDVKAVRTAASQGNAKAVLAMKVFTRSITKAIGGYSWLLGGLDAIVFAGGIGEHDATTRGEILAGLEQMGVQIDDSASRVQADGIQRISTAKSRTDVFVIPAQEDLIIALHVERMAQSNR